MRGPLVCILTSGTGSRMGPYAGVINKALLPVAGKALISHLIDRFPAGSEFVISLGHQGAQVRDYLELAHPDVHFDFVAVDRIEGPGTGPGYSLRACRPLLGRPFYFLACDT